MTAARQERKTVNSWRSAEAFFGILRFFLGRPSRPGRCAGGHHRSNRDKSVHRCRHRRLRPGRLFRRRCSAARPRRPGVPLWGVTWRFVNEGNRAAFNADPEVYMPQFGGYDPSPWDVGQRRRGIRNCGRSPSGGFISSTARRRVRRSAKTRLRIAPPNGIGPRCRGRSRHDQRLGSGADRQRR